MHPQMHCTDVQIPPLPLEPILPTFINSEPGTLFFCMTIHCTDTRMCKPECDDEERHVQSKWARNLQPRSRRRQPRQKWMRQCSTERAVQTGAGKRPRSRRQRIDRAEDGMRQRRWRQARGCLEHRIATVQAAGRGSLQQAAAAKCRIAAAEVAGSGRSGTPKIL